MFFTKASHTDRRTDGPTDGPTDGRTDPVIEMRGSSHPRISSRLHLKTTETKATTKKNDKGDDNNENNGNENNGNNNSLHYVFICLLLEKENMGKDKEEDAQTNQC